MNKLKLVGAIVLVALTLGGCGLLPEKTEMEPKEPNSKQFIKIPDPPDPDGG